LIALNVCFGHSTCKTPLKRFTNAASIEATSSGNRSHSIRLWLDNEAGHPSLITSGTDPRGHAMMGVPHAIASIITRPNGSGQLMGNSNPSALPRKFLLFSIVHFAHECAPFPSMRALIVSLK
jgi:hypothetical protein